MNLTLVLPRASARSAAARGAGRHRLLALAPAVTLALLAACSTTPRAPSGNVSRLPPGNSQRDGPEANPPPNLWDVPDAVPQIEPLRIGGPNKPYEVDGHTYVPITDDRAVVERGLASWYGKKFHGHRTSSGEAYNMYAMTAAHKTLPIPSYARVRNPANGREVIVRVNDRGPFAAGRVIDLSYTAALKLGVLGGVQPVEIERITDEDIRTGAAFQHAGTRLASAAPVPAPAPAPVLAPGLTPAPAPAIAAAPAAGSIAATRMPPSANTTTTVTTTTTTAVVSAAAPAPGGAPVQVVDTPAGRTGAAAQPADTPIGMTPLPPASAPSGADGPPTPQTIDVPAQSPMPSAPAASATVPAAPPVVVASALPASSNGGTANVALTPLREESARAETPGGAGFWVQIGAYRQRTGALDFQHRLIDEQPWLAPLLAVFSENGLNRLQAGPYGTREDARTAAERIRVALQLVPTIVEKR